MMWSILSAGAEDADILFEDELRALSEKKKEKLLHDTGITVNIPLNLAIKSMLAIQWYDRPRNLIRSKGIRMHV